MILFSAGLEWPFSPQLPPQDNIYGLFDVTGQASINCRNLERTHRFFWIAPFGISRKPKFNHIIAVAINLLCLPDLLKSAMMACNGLKLF
jgi:hypothetical protein